MRALLTTLLFLACGCAGQPGSPGPTQPEPAEPTIGLTKARANQLAADLFQMSHDGLDLLQQQELIRARAVLRTALTALTDARYDQGLHDLGRVRSLIEVPLRRLPLDKERRVVRDLIRKTKHWQAEVRREKRQRRQAAARDAALGY